MLPLFPTISLFPLFQLYILVSRTRFYPVLVKFPPCGAPSLTRSTKYCETLKSKKEWHQLLGQPLKQEGGLETIQVTSSPTENLSWKKDILHLYFLIFFFFLSKLLLSGSEKLGLVLQSNPEINASDQQKGQTTLQWGEKNPWITNGLGNKFLGKLRAPEKITLEIVLPKRFVEYIASENIKASHCR